MSDCCPLGYLSCSLIEYGTMFLHDQADLCSFDVQKIKLLMNFVHFQTMGGDFSARGQQDCAKGIYCLAGMY